MTDVLCVAGLAVVVAAFILFWAACALAGRQDDFDEQAGIARRS